MTAFQSRVPFFSHPLQAPARPPFRTQELLSGAGSIPGPDMAAVVTAMAGAVVVAVGAVAVAAVGAVAVAAMVGAVVVVGAVEAGVEKAGRGGDCEAREPWDPPRFQPTETGGGKLERAKGLAGASGGKTLIASQGGGGGKAKREGGGICPVRAP